MTDDFKKDMDTSAENENEKLSNAENDTAFENVESDTEYNTSDSKGSEPVIGSSSALPNIFIYDDNEERKRASRKGRAASISSQKKLIVLALAAVLILGGVYAVLQATILKEIFEPEVTVDAWNDPIGPNGRYFVIPQYTKDAIQEVIISNQHGNFRYYRAKDNKLYFDGAEHLSYDPEKISNLVVNTYYMLSMKHLFEYDKDLSVYGLTPDTCLATVNITMLDSTSYKTNHYSIMIGNKILTEGGYYAMVEGKDAIFILDTTLEESFLADFKTFFVAQLAPSIDQTVYFNITDFVIEHGGEKFIEIVHLNEDQQESEAYTESHKMLYPGNYVPSSTNFSTTVLQSFISPVGESVVEFDLYKYINSKDKSERQKFVETLKEYNIIDENGEYYHKVSYAFDENEADDKDGFKVTFYISKQTDGYYYIYSLYADIIAAVPAANLKWIEWDLIKFVESGIFSLHIKDVGKIEVSAGEFDATFELSYINEGKGNDLTVLLNGKKIDTANFRQYYLALLYIANGGYASKEEAEGLEPSASIKVTTAKGVEREYVFYDIATRKSYYTIDGKGEFYVSRDYVKKLITDTQKILNGETIVGKEF